MPSPDLGERNSTKIFCKPGSVLPLLLCGLLGFIHSAKAQSTGEFISLATGIPNSACLATVTAQVRNIAARLFTFPGNQAAAYALRIESDGSQTTLPAGSAIVLDDRPVYLILFGTGIRNRSSLTNVQCTIGGITEPVEYAGPSGTSVPGLDQVNVRLTNDLKGTRDGRLVLTVDGISSNSVLVDIR